MTTRLCKYHGRACEYPGQCLNHRPRKYEGDGESERIDPERLTPGSVVRMNQRVGMSAFSDSVVLSIRVDYSAKRQKRDKVGPYHTFDSLHAALEAKEEGDWVMVKLARPYLYEHCGSALMGSEQYEVDAPRMLDCYKVVVLASGAYESRTATFSTIYKEVRVAEEAQAAAEPWRKNEIHNHMGRSGFPHTCPACAAEREKLVKGEDKS